MLADEPGKSVHIDMLRDLMRHRGWVDPEWRDPDVAIYAALVRLTDQNPLIERVSRCVWRMRPDGDTPVDVQPSFPLPSPDRDGADDHEEVAS